ncbi:MAG: (d)CMP kinase [Betaproteobacteria bacterium]
MTDNSVAPVLTIDGPTASGKGTLARRVAQALGFHYLDSGAIYRAYALFAEEQQLNPEMAQADPALAHALALNLPLRFHADGIMLGDREVSEALRAERIGNLASEFSALPEVRAALLARQRAFRSAPGLVADGRDMGTVVFPEACLKVFLVAALESRAKRRTKQLIEKGFSATLESVLANLRERDARDQSRSVAPLEAAPEARLLDGTTLSIEDSVEQVLQWWAAVGGRNIPRSPASPDQHLRAPDGTSPSGFQQPNGSRRSSLPPSQARR